MKKIITFGQHSAELYAGEHRAALVISESYSSISKNGGVETTLNFCNYVTCHMIW